MKNYDKNTFTYGCELEWGDVDRRLTIPEHLGAWEYSETDVVNQREPYRGVASDPKGLEPPFGGEINTKPTKTWQQQVDRIMELKKFFTDNGCPPTASCLSHTHIHIHVPGLTEDIDALKRLVAYVRDNQDIAMSTCYPFTEDPRMKENKGAKTYLKWDGGRRLHNAKIANMINLATDFNDFISYFRRGGIDPSHNATPIRFGINIYNLKNIKTIEFRCFRATTERAEYESCFKFVELFIDAALNDGKPFGDIIAENEFTFPPLVYDHELFAGHARTKWGKERGIKSRTFYEVQ